MLIWIYVFLYTNILFVKLSLQKINWNNTVSNLLTDTTVSFTKTNQFFPIAHDKSQHWQYIPLFPPRSIKSCFFKTSILTFKAVMSFTRWNLPFVFSYTHLPETWLPIISVAGNTDVVLAFQKRIEDWN